MNNALGYRDALLDHADALSWDVLPAEARAAALTFSVDVISVGLSACRLDDVQRQYRLACVWGPGEVAPLGGAAKLSVAQAAFINALQMHCQEYDPVHEAAVVHAMSVVSGACLAVADGSAVPVSGRAYLEAVVAGVDVAVGLGIASRAPMRFFRPATAGLMGAVVALAKLHGADRETAKNALGLAYSQVSGTMQSHLEGSPALAYQIGFAARNAVFAWDMAAAGSSGPHDVIEGPFGYMPLIERDWDLQPSLEQLGKQWAVCELSHKPYPTGRAAHAALHMFDQILQQESLTPEQIRSLTVAVPPLINRLVGRPYVPELSLSQARLCLPYLLATRLLNGPITLRSYDANWIQQRAWQPLADRVAVIEDGNDDPNALSPQTLNLVTNDGRTIERRAEVTFGSPDLPMSEQQQFDKFCDCLDFGGIDGGDPDRRQQWQTLRTLAEADDVAALLRPLRSCG